MGSTWRVSSGRQLAVAWSHVSANTPGEAPKNGDRTSVWRLLSSGVEPPAKVGTLRRVSNPSFIERVLLAFRAFFRVLFDAEFAGRLLELERPSQALTPAEPVEADEEPSTSEPVPAAEVGGAAGSSASDGALLLLGLLQREGRLVDFLQQEVEGFADAEIGQAARVVHEGCRATLRRYVSIEAIVNEKEGSVTTVPSGFDSASIKLVGNVSGSAPFRGTLRHKGWRASSITLPQTLEGHAFDVLAPAEVEL